MPKIVDLLGSSSVESATVTPRETEVRTVPERLAWQTEKDFWGSPSSGGNASEHTEGGSVDSVVENRRTSSGESGSNSGNRGRHLLSFAISNDSSVPVVEPAENLPVVEALKTVHPQRVRAISVGAGGNSPVEKTAFGRARRASEGTYDVAGQRSLRWCLHDDYAEEEEKQYGDVGEREPMESIETAVRRAVASVEEIPLLSTTVEVVPLGGVLASTAEKLSSSSVGLTSVYHVDESDGMTGCSNSRVMSPDPVAEEGSSISDTSAPRRTTDTPTDRTEPDGSPHVEGSGHERESENGVLVPMKSDSVIESSCCVEEDTTPAACSAEHEDALQSRSDESLLVSGSTDRPMRSATSDTSVGDDDDDSVDWESLSEGDEADVAKSRAKVRILRAIQVLVVVLALQVIPPLLLYIDPPDLSHQ